MTVYPNEPQSAAEMIARYRDVKRRLNTAAPTPSSEQSALKDLETIVAFVLAVAAVACARAREAARRADLLSRLHAPGRTPGSAAKAELRAVSERTGVPVEAILGRERIANIAAARHEAVWRVHQVTRWSLPRVGRFFGDRDHTTVLNSLRRMEERAGQDPELRAMMSVRQNRSRQPLSSPCTNTSANGFGLTTPEPSSLNAAPAGGAVRHA
jgi:chromosomal replication initiation ATPase DnaA